MTTANPALPHTWTAADGGRYALIVAQGPGTYRMYQDVTVPLGATTLSWNMQYVNTAGAFDVNNQYIAVDIRSPVTDSILATPFKTLPGAPLSTWPTNHTVDVSAKWIRIDFQQEVYNFYFDAGYDNVVPR